jgi:oligopeptide/dipeptide ABC transporter ATP-binding protein
MLFSPPYSFSGMLGLYFDAICVVCLGNKTTHRLGGSHPVSRALGVESGSELNVAASSPVLEIEDLKTHFFTPAGIVKAVDGVSYSVRSGETLGVVGESGCGKSVTALSVLRLVADPPGRIVGGTVRFVGRNLLDLQQRQMEEIRGNEISMIFQEPMTSLNPLFTVGRQISEAIALHRGLTRRKAMNKAIDMLRRVSIPEPEQRAHSYPHQMSGGMRQRVMIAMALSCNPKVLIADEPTTALDVTIQAQILALMRELQQDYGMAIVLITHDMGVVAENADRVIVMYAGRKVEEADVDDLFERPGHPYTRGLLGSIPHLDEAAKAGAQRIRLNEIKGMVPSLVHLPQGCSFAPRCSYATDQCRAISPPLAQHWPGHWVACWHADRLLEGRE